MRKSVIVGVDGSPSATLAATLGGDLAVRHSLPLELVHVYRSLPAHPPLPPGPLAVRLDPRITARQILATAAADLGERYPRLTIDTSHIEGHAAGALVDASRRAAFLVVGHRGQGGFTELLVGSVGLHVSTHAHSPVIVVRGEPAAPTAPVVVGIDWSLPSRLTARLAFDEARSRGSELVVALVWPPTPVGPGAGGPPAHVGGTDPTETDPVEAGLGRVVEQYPDVKVRRELRRGASPPQVLAALAGEVGAGLLVVGSRGIGGFPGLLMGGTCRALVDHAPVPVLVVPQGAAV
jgi:nucleotide-binding universal stress UspA family protein